MSETLFDKTINYVTYGDVIDPDNYNTLTSVIIAVMNLFLIHYEQVVESIGDELDYVYFRDYNIALTNFNIEYDTGKYKGVYGQPVYTWHYQNFVPILKETYNAIKRVFDMYDREGIEVPETAKDLLNEIYSILTSYPKLKSGDIVQPEHHNYLISIIKKMYDILMILDMLCGKYDLSRYGQCLYC